MGLEFCELVPPPQEHTNVSNAIGSRRLLDRSFFLQPAIGKRTIAGKIVAQSQRTDGMGLSNPMVRDVVVTETLNGVVELPVTFTLDGTEQLAPLGAPLQLSVALPLKPAPPISRL